MRENEDVIEVLWAAEAGMWVDKGDFHLCVLERVRVPVIQLHLISAIFFLFDFMEKFST